MRNLTGLLGWVVCVVLEKLLERRFWRIKSCTGISVRGKEVMGKAV